MKIITFFGSAEWMTPPLLTNAISFHLVNSGLIRMKLSVIFPETHRCRKKEGAWSWCNWGGCNSHMYSTPVNFQVVYCILEQFRPRRNFAVFYFFPSSLLYATVNTRVCQNTFFSKYFVVHHAAVCCVFVSCR